MDIPEFQSIDTVRRLWWLHDSFWHAALVKELGFERANRINAEVAEKIGRMIMNQLLREKVIERPRSIQDVMSIFVEPPFDEEVGGPSVIKEENVHIFSFLFRGNVALIVTLNVGLSISLFSASLFG